MSFFLNLHSLQCLSDARWRAKVGVCREIAAKLDGADAEDRWRGGQCGGKLQFHTILKIGAHAQFGVLLLAPDILRTLGHTNDMAGLRLTAAQAYEYGTREQSRYR